LATALGAEVEELICIPEDEEVWEGILRAIMPIT
jgi:hypothetical protein